MNWIFRDRHGTLDVSILLLRGRRGTSDVGCVKWWQPAVYVAGVGLYDMVETSQILIRGVVLCWSRFGTRFSSKVSRLSVNLMCVCVWRGFHEMFDFVF